MAWLLVNAFRRAFPEQKSDAGEPGASARRPSSERIRNYGDSEMLNFRTKAKSAAMVAGAALAVMAFANVAAADEGQAETVAAEETTTVEVLPVYSGDEAVPAEEPILEPGDEDVVAIVHDLGEGIVEDEPGVTPALELVDGPVIMEGPEAGDSDTVFTVNSHMGVAGSDEPVAGFMPEPVLNQSGAELLGDVEHNSGFDPGWKILTAVLVITGLFAGGYLIPRARRTSWRMVQAS
jgi:hypothetical protein